MHLDCDSLLECFCQCRGKVEILISALERCQLSVTLTAGGLVWYALKLTNWNGDLGTALQVWPQQCWVEGRDPLPPPAGLCLVQPRIPFTPLQWGQSPDPFMSGRGWVWQVCELAVKKCRLDRRWELLSVKYLKLLYPSQAGLTSNRGWGGQKWGLKRPACFSVKLLQLFL